MRGRGVALAVGLRARRGVRVGADRAVIVVRREDEAALVEAAGDRAVGARVGEEAAPAVNGLWMGSELGDNEVLMRIKR